jgi:hypothetical protein
MKTRELETRWQFLKQETQWEVSGPLCNCGGYEEKEPFRTPLR